MPLFVLAVGGKSMGSQDTRPPRVETRGLVSGVRNKSRLIGLGSRKLPMGCQIFNRRLGKSLDLTVELLRGA